MPVRRVPAVRALAIPDRNALAPPELPADAPVLDVVEPVQVNLGPALRVEFDQAVADHALGLLDLRVTHPPLLGQPRLDRHVGALGIAHIVRVGLLRHQRARGLFPCGKAVQPRQLRAGEVVERAVGIEHVHHRQLVAQPDFMVGAVVGRRNL